jgi:hypothetical protein
MQPSQQEARPPYVTFAVKAEEARGESIAQGRAIMHDVHYAFITPHGSKDRVERKVSEWFAVLEQGVSEERMPQAWLTAYRAAYEAWKTGQSIPLEGTSVKNWPLLTPAQIENLIQQKVLTVEDLAAANEELIMRLGMGGRALKEKAKAWLDTAGSGGAKVAERVVQLEAANRELAETNKNLKEAVDMLRKDLKALKQAEPQPA